MNATSRPTVTLLAAISIDGFIAPADKEHLSSTTWTSREDLRFFVKTSKEIGTMIIGSKTFETIKRALPERKMIVMSNDPERYANYSDPNLFFTKQTPEEILADLAQQGARQVALCGGAHIYSLFLQKGLVDRMFLTMEPYLFGAGVKLMSKQIKMKQNFVLVSHEQINDGGTIVLEYAKV